MELDVVVLGLLLRAHAFVVVVDGDGERLLRALLPDDVLVEHFLDLGRLRYAEGTISLGVLVLLLGNDVVAERDALVADVHGRSGDELLHLFL